MDPREKPQAITVAVSDIETPGHFRKPKARKVNELMRSIEADGLLQPIGIRRGTSRPYSLVFGGHRLESFKQLKKPTIEARLLDLQDDEVEAAMHAENLFRNPLSAAEYLLSIKRWQDIHAARFPETIGEEAHRIASRKGGRARQRQAAERRGGPAEPAAQPVRPGRIGCDDGPAEEPARRFDATAAEAMNVSPQKVRKDARAARVLSETDLEILAAREVPLTVIRRLADIKDPGARQRSLALVASGMDPETAIAYGTAPEGATVEAKPAGEPPAPPEHLMADDQWLDHYCGDALARLAYQASFRRDAIVWRKTVGLLNDVRSKTRKTLARSRAYKTGPFQWRLTTLLDVRHPNDWPRCAPCNGTGNTGNISQCPSCHGHGYTVATGGTP